MHSRKDHYDNTIGRIEIILGPMFSGKSTELIRLINRHKISKRVCCVIKHSILNEHSPNDIL
jgi:thymidine kinase